MPLSAPQLITECKVETYPTTATIHPKLKDSIDPDCGPDGDGDLPFIDEEEDENVDLNQREMYYTVFILCTAFNNQSGLLNIPIN